MVVRGAGAITHPVERVCAVRVVDYRLDSNGLSAEVSNGLSDNGSDDGWQILRQLKEGVPREYLNRLSAQSPINGCVTIVVVVLTAVLLLLEGYSLEVWVWAAAQIGLSGVMLSRWWRRKPGDLARRRESDRVGSSALRSRRGLYRAIAWAAGSGLLWGVLTVFLPGAPPHVEIALILTMGGMAAGSSATLAAVPLVAALFILGCTVPATIYYLVIGGGTANMLALVFVVFITAMIAMSQVVFQAMLKQFDAERHVRQLEELGLQQRIAALVNEATPLDLTLRQCLSEVRQHLRWPAGRIHWLGSAADPALASTDLWNSDAGYDTAARSALDVRLVESLRAKVREQAWPVWSAQDDNSRDAGPGTMLAIPILIGNEIAAVMELFSARREQPDQELLDMLATVGILIGRAIERRRAEEQLQRAQKMEAVGQLSSGIAHDFNNILMVAMGNIELLKDRDIGDDVQTRLATVLAALGRAADKVRALLAFSRRSPIRPEVLDLKDVIGSMMLMVAPAVGEQVEIDVDSSPDLGFVEADPVQLETALLNLALNASAAMPSGGRLRILLGNHTVDGAGAGMLGLPAGDYVTIEIADSGVGISPAIRERVFEPFFTTKPVGQGSGLGLSMVYGFMKQSGGAVTLTSEEGSGTSVCLYFPKVEASPVAASENIHA